MMKHCINKFYISFLLPAVFFSIASAGSRQKEQADNIRRIEINPAKPEQIKLSQIFSKADIIKLNESSTVFAKPKKMIVKNDCFYMKANNMIIVYSQTGDLILTLSKRGNGPGEYIDIADFQIEDDGNILINDREGRRLVRYNAAGEHVNTIHHKLLSYNFLKANDKIYLNSGDLTNSQSEYRVNVWNEKNNLIENRYIKQKKELRYLSVIEYTNFSFFSGTVSYCQSFSNTIYQLVDGQSVPRLEIDFGRHNLPAGYTKQYSSLRLLMENFSKSDYASRIDGYREGDNYLFFSYSYQDKRPFFWLSKADSSMVHYDEFEDDFIFPGVIQSTNYKLLPIYTDENYVYLSMEAYEFLDLYEKAKERKWENKLLVEKICRQINEDSNALIIRYKIK